MKRPILLKESSSDDTIACLEHLLDKAKRGELVGLAFGAIMRRSHYMVHATGAASQNPTFARGVIAALDDHLREAVHAWAPYHR